MRTTSAFGIVAAAFALGGCTTLAYDQLSAQRLGYDSNKNRQCRALLQNVRSAVAVHKTGDAENVPVRGFPYFRTNRVLAKLGDRFAKSASGPAFDAWVERLRALDREATKIEIANLPGRVRAQLYPRTAITSDRGRQLEQTLEDCAGAAKAAVLASSTKRAKLVAAVHVAEDYSDSAQTIGLFALTSIPVARHVRVRV